MDRPFHTSSRSGTMTRPTTRRQFLKQAAGASAAVLGAPFFVPASVLGRDGKAAPGNRIVMGCIGTGGRGKGLLNAFLRFDDVQLVAICDVDAEHRSAGRDVV